MPFVLLQPAMMALTISISRCVRPNAFFCRRAAFSFFKLAPMFDVGPRPTHMCPAITAWMLVNSASGVESFGSTPQAPS